MFVILTLNNKFKKKKVKKCPANVRQETLHRESVRDLPGRKKVLEVSVSCIKSFK